MKVCFRGPAWARALMLAAAGCAATAARAELFTYNVVTNSSQINLTAGGTLFGGALTVTEQQANAITRYGGTIAVDATVGGPEFVGGGAATAINPTGLFNIPLQYSPNVNGASGTAPANYGLQFTAPVNFDIPAINIPPEIIAALPPPLNTLIPSSLDLGVLSSVVGKVAIRDLALDIVSDDRIPRSLFTNQFDANETSIQIAGGYADISIAARLTQPDLLTKTVMQVLLSTVASSFPDIGLTVSSPSIFSLDIDLGFGFRVDLANLPALPNTAVADGTITALSGPPGGTSTLTLPVQFAAVASLEDLLGDLASAIDFNMTFDFTGTLVARATVPEASTLVMSGVVFALAGVGVLRRRKSTS